MSGVYILNNVNKNKSDKLYVKIGCSKDILKRISQIRSSFRFNGNLDELYLYKTIECTEYKQLEKILHQIMKSRKITNEWFLTEESFLLNRLNMVDLGRYK